MTFHLVKLEEHLGESVASSERAKVRKKFSWDNLEVNLYLFEEGERFYIDAAGECGLKTYVVIEGSLYNIETMRTLEAGDLLVVDGTQDVLHFDALEHTTIMIHSYGKSLFGTWEKAKREIDQVMDRIQMRDSYTREHCNRVFDYVSELGRRLGLKGQELYSLDKAARFHDIGKVYIEDSILNKRGKLSEEEYEIMKGHAILGKELILENFSEEIYRIIALHHERLDGSGYPAGLKGDEIPLCGRILTVCDCFDAMTTSRIYKEAKTPEQAIQELKDSEEKFDRDVVLALEQVVKGQKWMQEETGE